MKAYSMTFNTNIQIPDLLPVINPGKTLIGVDLGGTKLHVARIYADQVIAQSRQEYDAQAAADIVLDTLIKAIDLQLTPAVEGIGIGVPSIVNPDLGIVYETANIPSWREVPLKEKLEQRFGIPVMVNNDVNCFALGEYHYGDWQGCRNLVGMSLGTGLGVGLILNGQLYTGHACGAGELGELPYADGVLENYCSGQFFHRLHGQDGNNTFNLASQGDAEALALFAEFGTHLAQALWAVLLAYNPEVVVIGGSVARAFPYFSNTLKSAMQEFPYQTLWHTTHIGVSKNPCAAVLGATALFHRYPGISRTE
jgi:glucokinase